MTVPVFLRRAAELDLAAIEDWYDSQREGLGGEFRQVVDEAITRIADRPLAYPERYRGARRSFYDGSHTCSGTDRLKASWLFWHACTASVTRGRSVLGFAGGRKADVTEETTRGMAKQVTAEMLRVLRGEKPHVLGNPDLWPKLGHLE